MAGACHVTGTAPEPAGTRYRPMDMRHLLGILLALTLVLAGCGAEDGGPATGRTTRRRPRPPTPTEATRSGPVELTEVVFVSESAVGGNVLSTATTIDGDAVDPGVRRAVRGPADGRPDRGRGGAHRRTGRRDAGRPPSSRSPATRPTEVSSSAPPAGLQVTSPPGEDRQAVPGAGDHGRAGHRRPAACRPGRLRAAGTSRRCASATYRWRPSEGGLRTRKPPGAGPARPSSRNRRRRG